MTGSTDAPIVLWFKEDLRTEDHPALFAAASSGAPVIPLFVWSPDEDRPWAPGAASRWWLHHALQRLEAALAIAGSRLIIRRGEAAASLLDVCRATGARAVFDSRRLGPVATAEAARVAPALAAAGIQWERFAGALLYDPECIATAQGGPYQVFTPFWRQCLAQGEPRPPLSVVRRLKAPANWPASLGRESLGLLPKRAWDAGLVREWLSGDADPQAALRAFVLEAAASYPVQRDQPAVAGTSRLSPYLRAGELSPHMIWRAVRAAGSAVPRAAADAYLRQLGWREFAQHLLHHFPHTASTALRVEYDRFPWIRNDAHLRCWQAGQTGFPIVDAGMRQLWETGWMHNRVRMIVASFLVKDLLLAWQSGAAWFWDTLVDADLANNTLGWQWAAGCGADAAPYFRIFNPTLQGEKFDPDGAYVRRYVPELARLPSRWIHKPALAPEAERRVAGVQLGVDYPAPIVSHTHARMRALAALQRMREARAR